MPWTTFSCFFLRFFLGSVFSRHLNTSIPLFSVLIVPFPLSSLLSGCFHPQSHNYNNMLFFFPLGYICISFFSCDLDPQFQIYIYLCFQSMSTWTPRMHFIVKSSKIKYMTSLSKISPSSLFPVSVNDATIHLVVQDRHSGAIYYLPSPSTSVHTLTAFNAHPQYF